MAKIGLNNFRYGILTEAQDGTPSYSGAKKPAKAISCNVSVTNNEAKLYADDMLAESDTSFAGGTVEIGIDDEDTQTMADMLGHEVSPEGEMIRNASDVAPYIGLGRVVTKMVNGLYKYKAEFLYKVKFSEPSQEDASKGESVEFATSTLSGILSALANGDWSKTQTFDTKAEAIEYIETILGGTPTTSYTVTYDVNGGTGTVAPVTVTAGESITLNDGTGITAPDTKTFVGWATTSDASVADVSSPYTPTGNITLYAVYTE